MQEREIYDVLVVGAGPAGLMAAGCAASSGASVLVCEKNAIVGKKLSVTGGGRCNITNNKGRSDPQGFLKMYGKAAPFLHSVFARFSVQDTFDFFHRNGLDLVVQARERVFPHTERASDVRDVTQKYARSAGAQIRTKCAVRAVKILQDGIIEIRACQVFYARALVLAAGGLSGGPTLGSNAGFRLLRSLGHTVHPPSADLVPLKSNAPFLKKVAGVSRSFTTISFKQKGKTFHRVTGKILFTHFGLSGPLIINASHYVKERLAHGTVMAHIDLFPDTDHKQLGKRIISLAHTHPGRQIKNVLTELLPASLAHVILHIAGVPLETKSHQLHRDDRQKIVRTMKEFAVPIVGTMGLEHAIVADGGVPLEEIDMKTMQSLRIPSVFVIGDLLNIQRPSGGYSLQLCWSTGAIAGRAAARVSKEMRT